MTRPRAENVTQGLAGQIEKGVSGTNAAQTVTIAAPGANQRNHLTGLICLYSDASDHAITVTVNGVTLVLNTGTGVNGLILTGLDLEELINTTITIDAVAGGPATTSTIYGFYYVESTL